MRTVLPLDIVPIYESKVRLVDQCRWLEDVTGSLAGHLARSHAVQLLLHQRRKGVRAP